MSPWRYSLREVARRPGRSLLTLCSIILGVASVLAIQVAAQSARSAFTQLNEALSGKADIEIVARGGGRFSEDLASPARQVQGVAAVPSLRQQTMLYTPDHRRAPVLAIGTDLKQQQTVLDLRLAEPGRPPRPGQVPVEAVLEEELARFAGVGLGGQVKILTRNGPRPLVVVGLVKSLAPIAHAQGEMVFLPLQDLQKLFRREGQIDVFQVVLAPGVDRDQALQELARRLPAEVQVRPAWQKTALASFATREAFDQGLFFASLVSLLAAVVLILNTFLMNVTERRGQIAVMRLIGARRRQVLGLLLREGVVLGLIGSGLGLLAGWGLAKVLVLTMERAFEVPPQGVTLSSLSVLLAFALGPAMAVAGAFFPARSAAQINPLEVLRGHGPRVESARRRGLARFWVGPVLAVLALTAWGLVCAGSLPRAVSTSAGVLLVGGLALAFRLVQETAIRTAVRLLRFPVPTEMTLAGRQLNRHPSRTFLTWAILFVAVACSVSMVALLMAVVQDVDRYVQTGIGADFLVRASPSPQPAEAGKILLPDAFVEQAARLPGVQEIQPISFVSMDSPTTGSQVLAVIRNHRGPDHLVLDLEQGQPEEVDRGLAGGGVVLSKTLAYPLHARIGDTFTVEYAGKTHSFPVVGTATLYIQGGSSFYVERDAAERAFGPLGVNMVLVTAAPGRRAEAGQALRQLADREGYPFQTFAEFAAFVEGIMSMVLAGLWALTAVGFAIAVFSVINTLLVNVLEQTREIGLVRVLGMTRRQVRRMFLAQSVLVGLLGVVPGSLVGLLLAAMVHSSTMAVLGAVPLGAAALAWAAPYAAGMLVLVLVFAWLPAARAARLPILDCIRID
jgi:putative ABC transport system permease protein